MHKQPWVHSRLTDLVFILSPPFVCLLIILAFPNYFVEQNELNITGWIILVVLIDVAHVYSTLFRTYLHPDARKKFRHELYIVPVAGWIAGAILYTAGPMVFWKALAYLAVFHFIRQQYGFTRIYSRKESQSSGQRRIDAFAIYAATLYPLIYWHGTADREFNWFLEGDFFSFRSELFLQVAFWIFAAIQATYIIKEILAFIRSKIFNAPRNLVWLGTLLSWYIGIVHLNGDLTFTLLNVVTHGIPYMALVYVMTKKDLPLKRATSVTAFITTKRVGILAFIVILGGFSFFEEGLWDAFIWREPDHEELFSGFYVFPRLMAHDLQALIVPLLALPQITHYVLDAFIWKLRNSDRKVSL